MSAEIYRAVIDGWCSSTGMQPWPADADMNVEIEGTVTGLLYDEARSPQLLHVLCDLGPCELPDLDARLLAFNAKADLDHGITWGVQPVTGRVVMRLAFPLTHSLDGARLPERIHAAVVHAREQLAH